MIDLSVECTFCNEGMLTVDGVGSDYFDMVCSHCDAQPRVSGYEE